MAINSQLTLVEVAKRYNDKNLLQIAEVLATARELLQDAVWVESNQVLSHVGTIRTSLPTGTLRQFNKGITGSASTTKQVTEYMAMLQDYSIVDEDLLKIQPDPVGFRSNEDIAFVEGMSQTMMTKLFYGNKSTNPEEIDGLSTRYDALADSNVLGAGGSGSDTTSVWMIEWGPTKVHMIYPKGSKAGVEQIDLGKRPKYDASSNPFEAYWTHFKLFFGVYVHDDRCVQRIANIETSGSSNTLDDDQMIEALNYMPMAGGSPTTRIYVNRTIKTQLDIMAKDKSNVNYSMDTAFGAPVTRFRGVPVRLCEQIVNTETAIT